MFDYAKFLATRVKNEWVTVNLVFGGTCDQITDGAGILVLENKYLSVENETMFYFTSST